MEPTEEQEISLSQLWSMVWYRLPMIITCAVLTFVVSLMVYFVLPEKYPVTASLKAKYISGIPSYSTQEIKYKLCDDDILMNFVDDDHSLDSLRKALNISINKDTGYIEYKIEKTADPSFWYDLIEDSVAIVNNKISTQYRELADTKLSRIEEDIVRMDKATENLEDRSPYTNLIISKSNMESNIADFENALVFETLPKTGEKVSTGIAKICILGTFLGCVIGGICTLIAGFTCKQLQIAEDVLNNTQNGMLILTIPEYKDPASFDKRHTEYLASLFNPEDKNIIIGSISENAGVKKIVDGLNAIESIKDKNIVIAEPFNNKPSMLTKAKDADKTIIILKRGEDTTTDLRILDKSLQEVGCKNVSYVFNFATKNDKYAMKYLPNKNYVGPKYRFW